MESSSSLCQKTQTSQPHHQGSQGLLELFLQQNPAQLSAQALSHSAAQGLRESHQRKGLTTFREVQCRAPKRAKMIYNSNNQDLR